MLASPFWFISQASTRTRLYMAFWHIAFVDEDCLVPCNDDALRNDARRKIDRYIADHSPVETFPRFYLVLLRQPIAPMEPDGMSRVYQM